MSTRPLKQTLRLIPRGTRFVLCRTGEKYRLISRSGYRYTVWDENRQEQKDLHHSCYVKPIIGYKKMTVKIEKSLHKVVAYDNHDMSQDIGLFETRDEAERIVADLAVHMTRFPEPADDELIRKWEDDSPIHKVSQNNYLAAAYFLRFVIEKVKIDSYPIA